jgi:uncharacterized membrane protein
MLMGWTVTGAAAVWAALLLVGPHVATAGAGAVGLLYLAGGLICHQMPERSFHLAGSQLPVCARCLGLYVGAAMGAAMWMAAARRRSRPLRRDKALTFLAVAAVPTVATVAGALAGVGDPSNAWRAALALPLGVAGGGIVAAVATSHLK